MSTESATSCHTAGYACQDRSRGDRLRVEHELDNALVEEVAFVNAVGTRREDRKVPESICQDLVYSGRLHKHREAIPVPRRPRLFWSDAGLD